jgi:AbrB family looped-hinge helix DNA binding protein
MLADSYYAPMAHSSTVSSKGQITLPKPLRDRHHLRTGEIVIILDSEDGIVIRRGRPSLRGMLKEEIDGDGFEKDLKKLRKEWTL